MATRMADLAKLAQGRLLGDDSVPITGAAPLYAAGPGEITLLDRTATPEAVRLSQAAAFLVPADFDWTDPRPAIASDRLHAAFHALILHFRPLRQTPRRGIHPGAHVSPTAVLAPDVEIYPGACIGDDVRIGRGTTVHGGVQVMAGCVLGEDVILFPNVVLYEDTHVGDRSKIHGGAVLGAHGFGYRQEHGRHIPSAQLGWVEIGADVDIGANTTVDRGSYGPTRIGDGTKIDNLVMIGHNCRIGRHNLLCSQAGIAGSVRTGDYVVLAGQAGIRDHVCVENGAIIGGKAGVMGDVPTGGHVLGSPAIPEKDFWTQQVGLKRLPDLRKQLKQLEQAVRKLEQNVPADGKPTADAA